MLIGYGLKSRWIDGCLQRRERPSRLIRDGSFLKDTIQDRHILRWRAGGEEGIVPDKRTNQHGAQKKFKQKCLSNTEQAAENVAFMDKNSAQRFE